MSNWTEEGSYPMTLAIGSFALSVVLFSLVCLLPGCKVAIIKPASEDTCPKGPRSPETEGLREGSREVGARVLKGGVKWKTGTSGTSLGNYGHFTKCGPPHPSSTQNKASLQSLDGHHIHSYAMSTCHLPVTRSAEYEDQPDRVRLLGLPEWGAPSRDYGR